MLGVMCLAIAAALGYRALAPAAGRRGRLAFGLVAITLVVEGWMPTLRMADIAPRLAIVEPPDRAEPILELPIGGEADWNATYRATWHGRRVVNGVSGYDPPHYLALVAGLQARDPGTLAALTSFSALDVVIDRARDPEGAIVAFVSSVPGASAEGAEGTYVLYRLPKRSPEVTLGPSLPIAAVEAFIDDAREAIDGRLDTGWEKYPQTSDMWFRADLGREQTVAGVSQSLGEYMLDYPRRLAIELSVDGTLWQRVWEGPTFGPMLMAAVRAPREIEMRFAFAPHRARFVRLLQLENFPTTMWRIQELHVHGS
jgi:hypothetical protein